MTIVYPKYVQDPSWGAKPVWDDPECVKFEGAVLCTREENGPSDSDFYAVCWDEEKQCLVRETYATTRFGGGGAAKVDATPEVMEKAAKWLYKWLLDMWSKGNKAQALEIKPDRRVKIIKGRKYPKGWTGTVGLLYTIHPAPGVKVEMARIDTDPEFGRVRIDVDIRNLEVVDPQNYEKPIEYGQQFAALNCHTWHYPFVASGYIAI